MGRYRFSSYSVTWVRLVVPFDLLVLDERFEGMIAERFPDDLAVLGQDDGFIQAARQRADVPGLRSSALIS
jgi:hypothetical protein